MTFVSEITFKPGQAAWVYLTFTNDDMITIDNPTGLVDADPVTVSVMDMKGGITLGSPDRVSLGFYRYLVQFTQGGGSYLIQGQGSALGMASEDIVIPVGRSPF